MKDHGYISQEEYDEAVADNVYDRIQLVNIESETNSINPYFVDELTDQVIPVSYTHLWMEMLRQKMLHILH